MENDNCRHLWITAGRGCTGAMLLSEEYASQSEAASGEAKNHLQLPSFYRATPEVLSQEPLIRAWRTLKHGSSKCGPGLSLVGIFLLFK